MDIETSQYEVEAILDRRIKESRVEYYIKWKGFSLKQSTWEPIHNLRKALRSVFIFEKSAKLSAQKKKKRRAQKSCSDSSHHEIKKIETIVIDSDEEPQKKEGSGEMNFNSREIGIQAQGHDPRIESPNNSTGRNSQNNNSRTARMTAPTNPIIQQTQEDQQYQVRFKNGIISQMSKKELLLRYPSQFHRYFGPS